MASRKKRIVVYRRKREGKTNYKKRLQMLLSRKPRFVVRKSNTRLIAQIISYDSKGDKVLVNVDSAKLKKDFGWQYSFKNTPAAYLLGVLAGKQAIQKKLDTAVFDLGRQQSIKGSKLYAVLKGAIDSGMKINAEKEVFPKQERIEGKHITSFSEKDSKQFSKLKKDKVDFKQLSQKVQEIKTSILKK